LKVTLNTPVMVKCSGQDVLVLGLGL